MCVCVYIHVYIYYIKQIQNHDRLQKSADYKNQKEGFMARKRIKLHIKDRCKQ